MQSQNIQFNNNTFITEKKIAMQSAKEAISNVTATDQTISDNYFIDFQLCLEKTYQGQENSTSQQVHVESWMWAPGLKKSIKNKKCIDLSSSDGEELLLHAATIIKQKNSKNLETIFFILFKNLFDTHFKANKKFHALKYETTDLITSVLKNPTKYFPYEIADYQELISNLAKEINKNYQDAIHAALAKLQDVQAKKIP